MKLFDLSAVLERFKLMRFKPTKKEEDEMNGSALMTLARSLSVEVWSDPGAFSEHPPVRGGSCVARSGQIFLQIVMIGYQVS